MCSATGEAVVVIRATDTELDLSGSPAELRGLAAALARLAPGEHCRFAADTTPSPVPYTRLLASFEVTASGGPVHVSIDGDTLRASGSPDGLGGFASFFEFPDDARSGTHHHHEWWEGNEYITADSRPLVVSVAEQVAADVT
jgi:hypothetical protein